MKARLGGETRKSDINVHEGYLIVQDNVLALIRPCNIINYISILTAVLIISSVIVIVLDLVFVYH